jgi:transmembrane sensor
MWQAWDSSNWNPMPLAARTRWRSFLVHSSIATTALGLGLMSWYIAKPMATRIHQTAPGERLTVNATPEIDISLDADSSVTVSNAEPPQIELLRGNAYFDAKGKGAGKLQIKVGTTYIRDIGTRFSVRKFANGGTIAVSDGQVEISVETGKYLIGAHERADFDGSRVTGQRMIADADIAPWRPGR